MDRVAEPNCVEALELRALARVPPCPTRPMSTSTPLPRCLCTPLPTRPKAQRGKQRQKQQQRTCPEHAVRISGNFQGA
eukprot:8163427-Alexandrium_andersonii.AAC.1